MLQANELKVVIEWISQMNKHEKPKKFSPLQWSFSYAIKFVFISHADDVKREIRLHISRLLTNQKRESARSMG